MEDTFTIRATFEDFVSWLDGHTRRTLEAWRRAEVMTWQDRTAATVTAHGTQIAFTVQAEDESTVTLHAEPWHDLTPDAARWLAGTMDAIGRKFGRDPLTPEDNAIERTRQAIHIHETTGKPWKTIADDMGITDRQLRSDRKKYGTG